MSLPLPEDTMKIAIGKRILNEFASKILNEERMSKLIDARSKSKRLSEHSEMNFYCECDDKDCSEVISISTAEYAQVHHRIKQFIVIKPHVQIDIESIVESFNNYTLVEKFFPHSKPATEIIFDQPDEEKLT